MCAIQTIKKKGQLFMFFRTFNHSGSLIVGYLIPLRHKAALQLINRLLGWIVSYSLFLWE